MSRQVEIVEWGRHGESGWRWTERLDIPDWGPTETEFRTNGDGEGLWVIDVDGNHRQILGFLQYQLAEDEAAAKRQVIARALKRLKGDE